jgi:tellurite resistance-related uncharacterized protein
MTTPTPLWTDERLWDAVKTRFATDSKAVRLYQCLFPFLGETIIADYEAHRATQAARIAELEAQVAQLRGDGWETVGMGEVVMCACGEPQCYHAIEAIDRDLLCYEDISDESIGAIVVQLPTDWRLQRRREAGVLAQEGGE